MDGKIKTVFVRDSSGRVLGRSIMRVLSSGLGKKPVVFLERAYYSNGADFQIVNKLVIELAQKKAEKLKSPVVIS